MIGYGRQPVLPAGTLVKGGVSWLRDHWLRVIDDPGPAKVVDRPITIGRTEPERADETYRVRRYRVVPKRAE